MRSIAAQALTIMPARAATSRARWPQNTAADDRDDLPFLSASPQIGKVLALYAQYAKAFRSPI